MIPRAVNRIEKKQFVQTCDFSSIFFAVKGNQAKLFSYIVENDEHDIVDTQLTIDGRTLENDK